MESFELRFGSRTDLASAFEAVISYPHLGHCEVNRARRTLRFSALPGHEAALLRRVLDARRAAPARVGVDPEDQPTLP
jgi:hypothetical protein